MSQDLNPQVPKIERVEATPAIEGSDELNVSGKPFSNYMQPESTTPQPQGSSLSPMELSKQSLSPAAPPTLESISAQMQTSSSSLGDLQNKLNTPNLKLKPSQKYLLRNKLQEANSQIRTVAEKSGVEVGDPVNTLSRNNPIGKFLALITDGQTQLESAQTMLKQRAKQGPMNPADLLMMQFKLSKAQQEIEYSSVLLSKAVDDIKVIFNIQI